MDSLDTLILNLLLLLLGNCVLIPLLLHLKLMHACHNIYRLEIPEHDIERMIDEADRDNDKQLSFEDFVEILVGSSCKTYILNILTTIMNKT